MPQACAARPDRTKTERRLEELVRPIVNGVCASAVKLLGTLVLERDRVIQAARDHAVVGQIEQAGPLEQHAVTT